MILNILLFIVIMSVVPCLVGMLVQGVKRNGAKYLYTTSYVKGMIVLLAIFQLLAVPFTFLQLSLTSLTYSFGAITVVLCLLSIVLNCLKFPRMLAAMIKSIQTAPWQIWIAVILIVLQTFVLTRYQHIDDDDAFYVATSAAAVETDTIYQMDPYTGEEYKKAPARYVLAPFPIFIAVVAKITQIHPTIVAHVGFAAVFILFTYMVYAMIGREFFDGRRRSTGYFLILVSTLHMFSAYSVYTPGVFLLTRIWQGKAVLAAALLPAVLFFILKAAQPKSEKKNWLIVLLTLTSCCMVSSMGVLLSVIVAGATAVGAAVGYRNWKVIPCSILCCIPNLAYAGIYILIK